MTDHAVSAADFAGITVLRSTDHLPNLEAELAERRAAGQAAFDEWWDGVYVVTDPPPPEHQRLAARVGALLARLADRRGLRAGVTVTVGTDEADTRVADAAVWHPGSPTDASGHRGALELVVEVLTPGETADDRLDAYRRWPVREHLEIDPRAGAVRLLRREGDAWVETRTSAVLELGIEPGALVADGERLPVPVLEP